MIGFLEGLLIDKTPGQALVQVGGVGYLVAVSLTTFYTLPEPPAPVALRIHTRIQEDALLLYGFHSQEEKDLFLQLLTIPRIGAKIALTILSGINPEEFQQALAESDFKRLSGIPGVGRKSAERIVLELRDRLAPGAKTRVPLPAQKLTADALSALLNLGYPRATAEKALDTARSQGAATLEELLRQSLKVLAK